MSILTKEPEMSESSTVLINTINATIIWIPIGRTIYKLSRKKDTKDVF